MNERDGGGQESKLLNELLKNPMEDYQKIVTLFENIFLIILTIKKLTIWVKKNG